MLIEVFLLCRWVSYAEMDVVEEEEARREDVLGSSVRSLSRN